tara:strand:+ start:535 stop:1170 length:636 start_codon:yes stop_codon:yes gene_type:complete
MAKIINDYTTTNKASRLIFESLVTKEIVTFPAFVSSFSQTFTSNWNSEVVYGRNDPIGNFQGTQRGISVSWDVLAGNLGDAIQNFQNINGLVQMLYPGYATATFNVDVKVEEKTVNRKVGSNALALSKPPLIRLEYGNLIRATQAISGKTGLLGWINSFSWNPSLDMGMFTNGNNQYPKVISLSIDFTPQHEHELGTFPGGGTPAEFPFGG